MVLFWSFLLSSAIKQLKAFTYQWYARFDRGTRMAELLPFLPDAELKFVYPSTTLTAAALNSRRGSTWNVLLPHHQKSPFEAVGPDGYQRLQTGNLSSAGLAAAS